MLRVTQNQTLDLIFPLQVLLENEKNFDIQAKSLTHLPKFFSFSNVILTTVY